MPGSVPTQQCRGCLGKWNAHGGIEDRLYVHAYTHTCLPVYNVHCVTVVCGSGRVKPRPIGLHTCGVSTKGMGDGSLSTRSRTENRWGSGAKPSEAVQIICSWQKHFSDSKPMDPWFNNQAWIQGTKTRVRTFRTKTKTETVGLKTTTMSDQDFQNSVSRRLETKTQVSKTPSLSITHLIADSFTANFTDLWASSPIIKTFSITMAWIQGTKTRDLRSRRLNTLYGLSGVVRIWFGSVTVHISPTILSTSAVLDPGRLHSLYGAESHT